MYNKVIRLTESDLRNIIKESVRRFIDEGVYNDVMNQVREEYINNIKPLLIKCDACMDCFDISGLVKCVKLLNNKLKSIEGNPLFDGICMEIKWKIDEVLELLYRD